MIVKNFQDQRATSWQVGLRYETDDLVTYNGVTYRSRQVQIGWTLDYAPSVHTQNLWEKVDNAGIPISSTSSQDLTATTSGDNPSQHHDQGAPS